MSDLTATIARIIAAGELCNRYYALRHATSRANEVGIIVSHPENGIGRFGLSGAGWIEARATAERARRDGFRRGKVVVVSSDFDRAKETAGVLTSTLGITVEFDPRLRERNFGDYELTPNTNYGKVWAADAKDPTHHENGVQSVAEVVEELASLISDLEERYSGMDIILVSHGDRLQILETQFAGMPASQHRSLSHLKPAELRPLG